jgi:hypothetical protein
MEASACRISTAAAHLRLLKPQALHWSGPSATAATRPASAMFEHFLCGEQAVQRGWKSGINGHLHDDLNDFIAAQADIQAGLYVDLELGCRVAEGGESGDGRHLSAAEIETLTRINVAKRELNQVAAELGRDISQGVDDFLACFSVDFSECA